MPDQTLSVSEGSDGFFSILKRFFDPALEGLGKLVPIWAANALDLEQGDQLFDPTFQGPRDQSTTGMEAQAPVVNIQVPEGLGGGEIELNRLLLVGAAIALGFVFFFRR